MTCDNRNQDLLLLTHGELGGIRRALVEQHLRRCPRCQERRQRYGLLSSTMAGEIRPREMPLWSPRTADPESAPLSARRLALCVALAILLGVAATAGVAWSPPTWWRFGVWGKQSQTMDTSCLTNVPGNIPASASNQPAALPAGSHSVPATDAPGSPSLCPSTTPSAPHK